MENAPVVVPAYLAKPLRLEPFRAMFLTPNRVGDPGAVRHIARPYRDMAERVATWESDGLVLPAERDALHLHEYTTAGITVRGLVGCLDLTRLGLEPSERAVWPHERVHADQAEELAHRMEAIGINPAPILLACEGSAGLKSLMDRVATAAPDMAYTDRNAQDHRIWEISDTALLAELSECLAETTCVIADGHHRYAAYLELAARHPGTGWDTGLAMVVDQADTPFFLGPIHRTLQGRRVDDVARALDDIAVQHTRLDRQPAMDSLSGSTFVATDGQSWLAVDPAIDSDTMLVEWIHRVLIPRLDSPEISYHHTLEEALKGTCHGATLVLPAPSFADVVAEVRAGRLLPEKATSFQPKPTVGVIMRTVPTP